MSHAQPRFYDEFADWWPLFLPPAHCADAAADILRRLDPASPGAKRSLLELGSGGGSLASHLGASFHMTLTDRVPAILAVNRQVNPTAEHHLGDMRSLRLGRTFDVVLIHDAIGYATDLGQLRATLETAAVHCRPGGRVIVRPDAVQETFRSATEVGGEDAADGRGLRYLEWSWDPDPGDATYLVELAFLFRTANGVVTMLHDRHVQGLFSRADWLATFQAVGLAATASLDPWERDVFLAIKA
ncbi:MAG TPA: class I SAM-dependent methyltransferase [Candidatus Methylomirabilis sp.]|nr:class I SAM-dependent methyltransferase [Candidatus Methylomirabilis sp.]